MLSYTHMYSINKQNDYKAILLRQKERVFHTQDLGVLFGINNRHTLHVTITRYCQKGILQRIYRGLYATVPLHELDPLVLGFKALHTFAYLSCETVLQQHGLINALVSEITFVSNRSAKIVIGSHTYHSRKLKEKHLYNPIGITEQGSVQVASLWRAVADMLYFNPRAHFDAPVDWSAVQKIQQQVAYPLTPKRYAHSQT